MSGQPEAVRWWQDKGGGGRTSAGLTGTGRDLQLVVLGRGLVCVTVCEC